MNTNQKANASKWFYFLPVAYVLITYSYIPIPILMPSNSIFSLTPAPLSCLLSILFNCRLLVFAVLNLTVTVRQAKKLGREQLLNCSMLVKYSLIPLYLLGNLFVFGFAFLSSFLPGMILAAPIVALAISLAGWLILLGGAPFSIAYLLKAKNSGVLNAPGAIAAILMQFFFIVDVAAIMFFSFREKRWRALTVIILLALTAVLRYFFSPYFFS